MGELPDGDQTDLASLAQNGNGAPSVISISKRKRQGQIGGPMTSEELRLNKNLLKEISSMKKMERDGYKSPGSGTQFE